MDEARPETDYERADAPPWLIVSLAAILAISVALVLGALAETFPAALQPAPRGPMQPLPPTPRLQTDPDVDIARYKIAEEAKLGGYGWTADGHVRVPVEEAMRAVAKQGWRQ